MSLLHLEKIKNLFRKERKEGLTVQLHSTPTSFMTMGKSLSIEDRGVLNYCMKNVQLHPLLQVKTADSFIRHKLICLFKLCLSSLLKILYV